MNIPRFERGSPILLFTDPHMAVNAGHQRLRRDLKQHKFVSTESVLKIPWTEYVGNEEALKKKKKRKTYIYFESKEGIEILGTH